MEPFGDPNPWAEPAWYNALDSPYYGESHRKLRAYIREYMESNVIPYADEWEASGHVPLEATIKFAQAGLSFPEIPQEYRPGVSLPAGVPDEEWDVFHFMILHDETSRAHCGALSGLMGSSTIGAPPIIHHGTSDQKKKWLPGIFTGETRLCLGSTEPTGGSDVANLKTTAVKSADGKYYIVNGHKKWITGALTASHMTTGVRTGGPGAGGISVLVIPTDLKGFSARKIHNSGNNAGATAWVDLEDVHVPCENLIGPENKGFAIMMSNFNSERFVMAVKMNRYARVCLADAVEYSHRRHTFGKPLVAHQIIRHKFVTLARYVESHWAWLEQIAYHIKVNGWQSDVASRLALAKIHAGRLLELANREAQQVFGGAGYQRGGVGGNVEQISRDLRLMVVGGGSEEIISDLAVRQEFVAARKRGSRL